MKVVYSYDRYRILKERDDLFHVQVKKLFRWKPLLVQTHLGRQAATAKEFLDAHEVLRRFTLLKEYLEMDVIPVRVLKVITTKGFF